MRKKIPLEVCIIKLTPYAQNKLIVLHSGSIIDLAVDANNSAIDQVLSFEMSAGDAILIPKNYANYLLN